MYIKPVRTTQSCADLISPKSVVVKRVTRKEGGMEKCPVVKECTVHHVS